MLGLVINIRLNGNLKVLATKNKEGNIMRKWFTLAGLVLTAAITLGVLSLQAADTIKIGVVAPLTGFAAESGRYEIQGIKLAVQEINKAGGILGKPVELVVEDDQTSNPGIVLAFSKVAGDKDIPAFITSIRSTQVMAMAPEVLKLGKPVAIGGTDPQLTHMGNPWLFRFRPNDSYSARVIADYGVNTLQKKKWAILYSTDAFGTGGKDALVATLKGMGITPVLLQNYTNDSKDFTAVVLALKSSGADIMASYMTYEADLGIFAKQRRQLGVNISWIGSPSITNTTALRLAGPALYGTFGVADFNRAASPEAKAYAAEYQAAYKERPDNLSSWAYDAMHVLAIAINDAKSLNPEKIKEAILAVKGYKGAEGVYNFDQNGDGLHGYNVVKNVKGSVVFDKHVDFGD
jgi:branched-chain amino acid transport system substrate-binding protein